MHSRAMALWIASRCRRHSVPFLCCHHLRRQCHLHRSGDPSSSSSPPPRSVSSLSSAGLWSSGVPLHIPLRLSTTTTSNLKRVSPTIEDDLSPLAQHYSSQVCTCSNSSCNSLIRFSRPGGSDSDRTSAVVSHIRYHKLNPTGLHCPVPVCTAGYSVEDPQLTARPSVQFPIMSGSSSSG